MAAQLAMAPRGIMRLAVVDTACPVWAGVAPVVVRVVPAPLRAVTEAVTPVDVEPELLVADAAPPGPETAGLDRSSQAFGAGARLERVVAGFGAMRVAGFTTCAKRAGLDRRALMAGALPVAETWPTGASQVSWRLSANWVKSGSASITTWYWFRGL